MLFMTIPPIKRGQFCYIFLKFVLERAGRNAAAYFVRFR